MFILYIFRGLTNQIPFLTLSVFLQIEPALLFLQLFSYPLKFLGYLSIRCYLLCSSLKNSLHSEESDGTSWLMLQSELADSLTRQHSTRHHVDAISDQVSGGWGGLR